MIVRAEKWVNDGFCLGYAEGRPVFILGAVPGEVAEVELISEKKGAIHVKAVKILITEKERITSDCPVYMKCGGCRFRHISYSEEKKLKISLLQKEFLFRGIADPGETLEIEIHSADSDGYRNNVQLKGDEAFFGFHAISSNRVVEIPASGCRLLSDELNQHLHHIRSGKMDFPESGKLRLNFDGTVAEYFRKNSVFEVSGKTFLCPPDGFFQINRFLTSEWLEEIMQFIPESTKNIVELFSGCGLISVFAAERCEKLYGYEAHDLSCRFAEQNAGRNRIRNAQFKRKDLYRKIPAREFAESNLWIVNPPRNGLTNDIADILREKLPERIIYSSCNYISLARDLKNLQNHYKIIHLSIFDFFPRTPYFETLAVLEREK
ncbi:MAG TPA: methyltransferase [Leptospiraceae bacterium]|nr:methyltransferase [Leptospiraceae bacterium]HNF14822.1 methyltransferase [Leptospiraceae bacterium]HNI95861.1 methyltransferase [Leptospiraceae bacterium]HNN05754.1 methyltransferase [Leptospiraceae bacterium]